MDPTWIDVHDGTDYVCSGIHQLDTNLSAKRQASSEIDVNNQVVEAKRSFQPVSRSERSFRTGSCRARAFPDYYLPIGSTWAEGIDFSRRPMNCGGINLAGSAEPEVKAGIAGRFET